MIIRYLASPSVYSFSHFGSSTLGSPKHRVDAICGSILGCLVPSSLASPTNRVNHRISDTWLSPSIPAIPGPQWHVRGIWPCPIGQKKISHGHKKYRSTWFGQLIVRALVVRHEVAPATVPIPYRPLPGTLHHHRLWLRSRIASYPDYHTFEPGFNVFIFHHI